MRAVVRSAAPARAPERRQEARVEAVERVRLERVGGERADDLAALRERAAEAGVDALEGVRVLLEQPVEGVGERAVRREEHGVGRAEDGVEARVLAAGVSPHERLPATRPWPATGTRTSPSRRRRQAASYGTTRRMAASSRP